MLGACVQKIDTANAEALRRMLAGDPVLVDVMPAGEVLARLAWLRDALGPALGRAIRATGGIALKPIIARGLTMGDEMHQRNVACSSLLLRLLAPALARTAENSETLARCLDFIGR